MDETVRTGNEGGATVFAFAPEEPAAPVDAGKEATQVNEGAPSAETPAPAPESTVESNEEVDAPAGKQSQTDVGKAFAAERRRIEAKYAKQLEKDPMRVLGKMMVDDLMASGNLTAEEAVQKATENFLAAVSKRDNLPQHVVRRLVQQENREPIDNTQDNERTVSEIIEKLKDAEKPAGFDEQAAYADEEFHSYLLEMPVDKAIRLYHAEHTAAAQAKQDLAEKMRARQAIPQSIVPQQPAAPVADWTKASREDFLKEKERRRKLY